MLMKEGKITADALSFWLDNKHLSQKDLAEKLFVPLQFSGTEKWRGKDDASIPCGRRQHGADAA